MTTQLFSLLKKKKNQENKLKPTAFAISSSAPELFNYNSYLWVIVLWQVMCIWYVQYRIMIGVQNTSIWQAVREKNTLIFFSERKHGERESSSQNITQYRKLLAMRFFFPFSSVLISLFISLIESGFDIVCGKSCLVHSFISSFPGKQLGVHIGSPSLLHTLPFWKPQRISVFLNNVQN